MKFIDRLLSYNRTRADRTFVVLLLGLSAFQLATIAFTPLNLAPDEAHYWDWSRTLELSYYSKGPLVAVLIRLGCMLFGDTEFGVRFMAFSCSFVLSVLFYLFLRSLYGPSLGFVAWLALRSILIFNSMALVMTTDAPAALFWFAALALAALALYSDNDRFLIPSFVLIGAGVLAKYTVGALYISIALFFLLNKKTRRFFKTPSFYIGSLGMLAVISPIVVWNARNGWVNLAHNAGHIGGGKPLSFRPQYVFDLLGSQIGLVGPVIFIGICAGLIHGYRRWRSGDLLCGLYVFSALPLLLLCAAVSLFKRVYANWPMPVYLGGLALLVHLFAMGDLRSSDNKRWILPGIALSAVLTVLAYLPYLGFTLGVPGHLLPTKRLIGWDRLGIEVQQVLDRHDGGAGRAPFLVTDGYEAAAEIAFYAPSHPRALCMVTAGRRMNQYDLWADWASQKGRDAVVVLKQFPPPQELSEGFRSFEALQPSPGFAVYYGGEELRRWDFALGREYRGEVPRLPTLR